MPAFSPAFSSAFDVEVSDMPEPLSLCWPVDWSACDAETLEGLTPAQQALSEALAVQTLRMLTGYRVGGCPVVVRPCNRSCVPGSWLTASDVGTIFAGAYGGSFGFSPYVGANGRWLNACGCRGDGCSCTKVEEVYLPTNSSVGNVESVVLDGVTLDPSAYRIDNSNRLVRTDGGTWPVCQDMGADSGEGTFIVTYLDSNPVDGVGALMAGTLAAEFARSCMGAACSLPSNVQTVTRQGVTMEMEPEITESMFPGQRTGIRVVDQWIAIWNPVSSLPSGIYSPDAPPARRTTRRF